MSEPERAVALAFQVLFYGMLIAVAVAYGLVVINWVVEQVESYRRNRRARPDAYRATISNITRLENELGIGTEENSK